MTKKRFRVLSPHYNEEEVTNEMNNSETIANAATVLTELLEDYEGNMTGDVASTTGANAMALGRKASASGEYSIALGYDVNASDFGSTALGLGAEASNSGSTALGYGAEASNSGSTALGLSANASGYYSMALGFSARANGDGSTALGRLANASGNESTALGRRANASGNQSTALGSYANAYNPGSTALGYSAQTYASYSTAVGYNAVAYNANSIQLGGSDIKDIFSAQAEMTTTSDARLKTEAEEVNTARLEEIVKSLNVHRFSFINGVSSKVDKTQLGFYAQEVATYFPKSVHTGEGVSEFNASGLTDTERATVANAGAEFAKVTDTKTNEDGTETTTEREVYRMNGVLGLNREQLLPTLWAVVQKLLKDVKDLQARIENN